MFTYRTLALASLEDQEKVGDLIPQEVWDSLYAERLVTQSSDETGERWAVLTPLGRETLLSSLRGDLRG